MKVLWVLPLSMGLLSSPSKVLARSTPDSFYSPTRFKPSLRIFAEKVRLSAWPFGDLEAETLFESLKMIQS